MVRGGALAVFRQRVEFPCKIFASPTLSGDHNRSQLRKFQKVERVPSIRIAAFTVHDVHIILRQEEALLQLSDIHHKL